ncbi:hypothetical protein EIP91_011922 [Steccherinum ochraceum]|uniref:D-lactate dehydratase n=1 Tax=Steccherinum ochraceum TaxID=92696 RepID=A0A4R0RXN4_9APHY|nr:hypothetical protein EIP91_011922 [Steccherinum ochraceum]
MAELKKAVILIADGTEEMEFAITYDTLVRAGIQCTSAYVSRDNTEESTDDEYQSGPYATCSRGVKIVPDTLFTPDLTPDKYDLLIIPGGAAGANTISQNSVVQHLVREYINAKKYVGMICAALESNLPRQRLTSHPSVKHQLENHYDYSEDAVVVSDHFVTSRGPGTTFPFALTLVELLCGKEKRKDVAGPMVFPHGTFA